MGYKIENLIQAAAGHIDHIGSESRLKLCNIRRTASHRRGHILHIDQAFDIFVASDPDIIQIMIHHDAEHLVRLHDRLVRVGADRVQTAGSIDIVQILRLGILRYVDLGNPLAADDLAVDQLGRGMADGASHSQKDLRLSPAVLHGGHAEGHVGRGIRGHDLIRRRLYEAASVPADPGKVQQVVRLADRGHIETARLIILDLVSLLILDPDGVHGEDPVAAMTDIDL